MGEKNNVESTLYYSNGEKFEKIVGKKSADGLWLRVKALNEWSLRKSYESGLISKDQYNDNCFFPIPHHELGMEDSQTRHQQAYDGDFEDYAEDEAQDEQRICVTVQGKHAVDIRTYIVSREKAEGYRINYQVIHGYAQHEHYI